MTPILTSVMYLVINAVKDEVIDLLKNELAGVTYNKDLLENAVQNKIGNDLSYIIKRLKDCLKDGKLDDNEIKELQNLLSNIEV